MAANFDEQDQRKVNELQGELTNVLLRAADQKLEAALAVFALCRCARILLDKYPGDTRRSLLEAIEPFLRGDKARIDEAPRPYIVIPPVSRN